MKKLFSILLALALVLSLSAFAFATDIVITGGASGSEYAAYQILGASDGGEGKFAYTLNEKYSDILADVTGKTEQAEIVKYIEELDDEEIRGFVNEVYVAILDAVPAIAPDYTSVNDKFEAVAEGYYLIAETKLANEHDTYSLGMVKTAGKVSITVPTKEGTPTVEKKVKEENDSTGYNEWSDRADYDFGDTIDFSIEGTVSEKYAEYKSYYYSINDNMEEGLTYNEDAKIYVVNGEEAVEVTDQFQITTSYHELNQLPGGFVAEANLKELTGVEINADTVIRVEYSVVLNDDAVVGPEGNKNFVFIEYENNPYNEGDGNPETPDRPGDGEGDDEEDGPSNTPIDTNIVFTFDAVVNKTDKDGNPLEGAGFTLYKWIHEENDWVAVGEEMTGVTTFKFEKIDSGKYKLEESTVPVGYNKCEPIVFEVAGEFDMDTDPPTLTNMLVKNAEGEVISDGEGASFTVVLSEGKVSTDIINHTGAELPETGGTGRTIFYIVGAVLALGAVVLLITKKRMMQ